MRRGRGSRVVRVLSWFLVAAFFVPLPLMAASFSATVPQACELHCPIWRIVGIETSVRSAFAFCCPVLTASPSHSRYPFRTSSFTLSPQPIVPTNTALSTPPDAHQVVVCGTRKDMPSAGPLYALISHM